MELRTWYDFKMAFISAAINRGYSPRLHDNILLVTRGKLTISYPKMGSWQAMYHQSFDHFTRLLDKHKGE